MKPINEIKSEAWGVLTERKWFGPIIVNIFNIFLVFMLSFVLMAMGTNNVYMTFLLELMLYVCIFVPFGMGFAIYTIKFIRGEEVSVGNVFDGYLFSLKLIPVSVIMLGISMASNYVIGLSLSNPGDVLYRILGLVLGVFNVFFGIVVKLSYFRIYDNNGNVFGSMMEVAAYLLRGGIVKYLLLMLSFILWICGVAISMGMLAFLVAPYMETSAAIFYDEIDF